MKKKNKIFTKTILPTDDVYIQFTDEEIEEFGWEKGQKLEFQAQEDGSFKLIPFKKIELDIEEWPIEFLHSIIKESCEEDISVNDVINNRLKKVLEEDPIFKKNV
jgi:hypothetical protein